jgi:signal transduction histidine kinase
LPENAKDPISKIFHSAQRLVDMINDFLNISKIEQGSMTYAFAPLDLKKVLIDLVGDFQVAAGEKKLHIKTTIPRGKAFNVIADAGKIRQIISNLIDNAIKYTPKGSIHITLKQEPTHGESGMILLQIKDTGIGLSEDDIHHLFGKFARGSDGQKANTSGSGLGLYVAKRMMEEHKGNIWVESEGKEKGSVFSVELPQFHGKLLK